MGQVRPAAWRRAGVGVLRASLPMSPSVSQVATGARSVSCSPAQPPVTTSSSPSPAPRGTGRSPPPYRCRWRSAGPRGGVPRPWSAWAPPWTPPAAEARPPPGDQAQAIADAVGKNTKTPRPVRRAPQWEVPTRPLTLPMTPTRQPKGPGPRARLSRCPIAGPATEASTGSRWPAPGGTARSPPPCRCRWRSAAPYGAVERVSTCHRCGLRGSAMEGPENASEPRAGPVAGRAGRPGPLSGAPGGGG